MKFVPETKYKKSDIANKYSGQEGENLVSLFINNRPRLFGSNGNVRNKMHSPIFQNETHCHFVRKIIGGSVPVRSVIVFVNNNTENVDAGEVVGLASLSRYLKKLPIVLDRDRIPAIAEKLRAADRSDEISSRQHVRNVKRLVEGVEKGVCPRCGGKLVVKKDNEGEYYGCSNYPKCKFRKPI